MKSHSKYDCIMYKASKKSENKWIVIVIDYLNRILVKKKEKTVFFWPTTEVKTLLKNSPHALFSPNLTVSRRIVIFFASP